MQDQEGLPNKEIFLRARATEIARYFPIREAFWLKRLASDLNREVIFVCGDAHVESFGRQLEERAVPYRVFERGIGLTDEDAWFDEALLYLRDHPELIP